MSNLLIYLTLSIMIYSLYYFLNSKINSAFLNPLLLTSITIIIIITLFKISLDDYLEGTKTLSFLIKPGTVSLAIPMYKKRDIILKNLKLIFTTVIIGVLAHTFILVGLALVLKLDQVLIATLIPKSVTTAIAVDISNSLGGISELTALVVILTGILGSVITAPILKTLKINNSISIGMAFGCSSHALGTAKASEFGEVELSFSSISLVMTALITVIMSPLIFKVVTLILGN